MEHIKFSTPALFLACFAVVLCLGLAACQSDSDGAGSNAATEGAAQQAPQGPQVNPRKVVQGYLDRVKKSQQVYIDFKNKTMALQKEVAALPAGYKQQANGFADLEADLAKYPEKGTAMIDEATLVIKELEAQLESDWAMSETELADQNDEAMIGSVLLRRIKDLELNESSFEDVYGRVEKAVEKLKNAKGAPVELFR
ncbi:MAG: hypothetical protein R3D58_14505 [Saprospiraceae bacterium]